ncbi:uncharacterized protein LOC121255133 [Juglans microcarpa x Juglans regia]|uniref:uncharacterized protein LOC121255133 n=1 Tax=Juglans microcarpa x Juglans regia TaxID=2249226 RepID=UPI001B7DB24C|nr:uncharacterized protein LOC121255133 [Juglans microcarpa x Juglans regia]
MLLFPNLPGSSSMVPIDFGKKLSQRGVFSVKSAYAALANENDHAVNINHAINWKNLWKLKVQDRLKMLLWKISPNLLPTKALISTVLNLEPDLIKCPLCNTEQESLHHLFFNCIFSKVVWRQSKWPIDISSFATQPMDVWTNIILSPSKNLNVPEEEIQEFQNFAIIAMDNLWLHRNKVDHKQAEPSIQSYVTSVSRSYTQHCKAWAAKNIQMGINEVRYPVGSHLLTFDVAIRKEGSILASICWKDNGEVLFAIIDLINKVNSNLGEASAALMAIKEAARLKLENIIVGGDSDVTIQAISNTSYIQELNLSPVINDIRHHLNSFKLMERQSSRKFSPNSRFKM